MGDGSRKPAVVERPTDPAKRNYVIPRGAEISPRGTITKLRANLDAIRILKELETSKREPTQAERDALVKYSGWGALSQAFDHEKADRIASGEIATRKATLARYADIPGDYYAGLNKSQQDEITSLESWQKKWGEHHAGLREGLTEEEYRRARGSTINAHYTAPGMISAMWDMASRLGFRGGNVLEPATGIGHFFGLMPQDMMDRSKLHGVEMDSLSARIAQHLYPEAEIQISPFQAADIADNSIDLSISNVPFANVPVKDASIAATDGPLDNLHDYFFAKQLQKTRPGGLVMAITSAFTMDKLTPTNRKWLAERADLVAAYRLPNDAFRANAGTDVTTDILVLRKKDGKPFEHAQEWTHLDDAQTHDGRPIRVNEYFTKHPNHIMGLLADDVSMHAGKKEMTVHSDPTRPSDVALAQATDSLPADIAGDGAGNQVRTAHDLAGLKMGSITRNADGKFILHGQTEPDPDLNAPKHKARVTQFMDLRDALNKQYALELSPEATDADIDGNREELNRHYDYFKQRFSDMHHRTNRQLFADDPDYFRLLGAEIPKEADGGVAGFVEAFKKKLGFKNYVKADVFKTRVLTPKVEPTKADSIEDAMGMSLGWRGRVDTDFIGQLTRQSRDQVEKNLLASEIVVRDPSTGQIQSREEYLSGNVRKKLEIAKASGADYERNVRLLEKAQPPDVKIEDIGFNVGATWIPAKTYQDFLHTIGIRSNLSYHTPKGGSDFWKVEHTGNHGTRYKDFETDHMSVPEIMDSLLNMRRININYKDGDLKGKTNPVATTAAMEKAKALNEEFTKWARETPGVNDQLAERWNREVNAFARRTFDGRHLELPWASKGFDIFPDKKNAVWRAIQDRFGLFAHGVGGGKTIIGGSVALELRRLGMAKKPMIVVHNATLEQFADTLAKIAPSARVLVGRKDELQGAKRKEFLMRIAAGDWDAVVIAHSTFGLIEDDPAYATKHMRSMIDELTAALQDKGFDGAFDAKQSRSKDKTVKEAVKAIEKLEASIEEAAKRTTDHDLLNFQQLGVDSLIVDEVHKFKKMPFATKLDVKGIDSGFSKMGYALLMRARYIQERNGGKNVFTMTGTPVTNTLGEIWNQVRLVAPHLLKEYGVEQFDQFVSKFAKVESKSEANPTGERKMVERLAKIVNLPEWATFLRMAADVKMGDDMVTKGRPEIKGGGAGLEAVERTEGATGWTNYIRQVLAGFKELGYKDFEANPSLTAVPVQAYMSSRAAAIDIRLIDPRAKDEAGSKVNRMIGRTMDIYDRTKAYSGTQVIFADSYNPIKTSLFDGVVPLRSLQIPLDPSKKPDATFNLYDDIKAKLIARGVPESEIAIITDKKYANPKAKEKLFADVNEGKVRIVMGSTEKLGTGVNMQERMAAGHHLDVPWTPAGLEQRDGRVLRQGNMHADLSNAAFVEAASKAAGQTFGDKAEAQEWLKEHGADEHRRAAHDAAEEHKIELIRYGMKDTLDEALWEILARKQRFITSALSGKFSGREIEEDDAALTLDQQAAILSGPYGAEMFETDNRLRDLDYSKTSFESSKERRKKEISDAAGYAEQTRKQIRDTAPQFEKMDRIAKAIEKDGPKITVNGEEFATKTAMTEAVNKELTQARESYENDALLDKDHKAPDITSMVVNGTPIKLTARPETRQKIGESGDVIGEYPSITFTIEGAKDGSSFGAVTSAGTLLARLEELGGTVSGRRDSLKRSLARDEELAAMKGVGEWQGQAEFDKLAARRDQLLKLMSGIKPESTEPEHGDLARMDDGSGIRMAQASRAEAEPETNFEDGANTNERVVRNIPAAHRIADRFDNAPGSEQEERRAIARQALVKAARSHDPSKGSFEAYGGTAVRNAMRDHFGKQVDRAKMDGGSLDEPLATGEPETRKDMTPDRTQDVARNAEHADARQTVRAALAELPAGLRDVLEGIAKGDSYETIGERQGGISKQGVAKRANVAMNRMRQKLAALGVRGMDDIRAAQAARSSPEDFNEDVRRLIIRARDEPSSERTIGRPDLALGASDPIMMGVDEARKTDPANEAQTHAEWQAKADEAIRQDRDGLQKKFIERGRNGGQLDAWETKAAMRLVSDAIRDFHQLGEAAKPAAERDIAILANAYRGARAEQARGLAAGRDPFQTPVDRYREFFAKAIYSPPELRKKLDKATTPAARDAVIDEQLAHLAKIKERFAESDVTLDDLFSGRAEFRLQAWKSGKDAAAILQGSEKKAMDALMNNPADVKAAAKASGLTPAQVESVRAKVIAELRAKHFGKFEKGLKADRVDAGIRKAAAPAADAEAEFQKFLVAAGVVADPEPRPSRRKVPGKPFDMSDPVAVIRLAHEVRSRMGNNVLDMVMEGYVNFLLSSPQTLATVALSNTMNIAWTKTIQRVAEAAVNTVVRDPKQAQWGEVLRGMGALWSRKSFVSAWKLATMTFSAEHDMVDHVLLNEPVDLEGIANTVSRHQAIPGWQGRAVRLAGRTHAFLGAFFKTLVAHSEVESFALRIAKGEGLTGPAMETRIDQLVNEPGSPAWVEAVRSGEEMTHMQPLKQRADALADGEYMLGASELEDIASRMSSAQNPLVKLIAPFIKASFNFTRIGLRRSVGAMATTSARLGIQLARMGKGFWYSRIRNGKMEVNPEFSRNTVRDAAEAVLALSAAGLIYNAVEGDPDDEKKKFLITGSSPRNEASRGERENRRRLMGGDYTMRIGDTDVNFSRYEPAATTLGSLVDTIRVLKRKGKSEDALNATFGYFVSQLESKTFLKGIAEMTEAVQNIGNEHGPSASSAVRNIVANIVPRLIAVPMRNSDDYMRDTRHEEMMSTGTFFPTGSHAQPVIDVFGDPVKKGGNAVSRQFISSPMARSEKPHDADRFLYAWAQAHPHEKWYPETPGRNIRGKAEDAETGEKFKHIAKDTAMTPEQYHDFSVKAGARFKELLAKQPITEADVSHPTEAVLDRIKKAHATADRDAKAAMFGKAKPSLASMMW